MCILVMSQMFALNSFQCTNILVVIMPKILFFFYFTFKLVAMKKKRIMLTSPIASQLSCIWQVPIYEMRNDGRDNLLGALLIAGQFVIPEVSFLVFCKKLHLDTKTRYHHIFMFFKMLILEHVNL